MTPREAADVIGCSTNQVRVLCRKGILDSSRVKAFGREYYAIEISSVQNYASRPQTRGYPRGKKRSEP
jgi:hypothetical protein